MRRDRANIHEAFTVLQNFITFKQEEMCEQLKKKKKYSHDAKHNNQAIATESKSLEIKLLLTFFIHFFLCVC